MSNGLIKNRKQERYAKLNCNLVYTEAIINQWQNELENTSLNYISITTKKFYRSNKCREL